MLVAIVFSVVIVIVISVSIGIILFMRKLYVRDSNKIAVTNVKKDEEQIN